MSMKIRFFAALLVAALSITVLSGCAAVSAAPAPAQPVLTAIEESTVPLASAPQSILPAATEAPTAPVPAAPAPTVPAAAAPAPTEAGRITKDEAIAIALKDAGLTKDQVKGLRAEFDYDDGRPEYDVDFRQGGYEYDYEIHAETGKILSRDKEWDD